MSIHAKLLEQGYNYLLFTFGKAYIYMGLQQRS